MIVECPSCKTNFPVDPNKVPEGGVHARCSACSQVFFVEPPSNRVSSPTVEEPSPPVVETIPEHHVSPDETSETHLPGEVDETSETRFSEEGDEASETLAPGEGEDVRPPEPLFGRRDPMEKAQRLARVLVSDIILYNPDRHRMALDSGRVREEFEEEIQKSWDEYVEQVGEEVATGTSFFEDALSEILAVAGQEP